jgi:hypothetical protein
MNKKNIMIVLPEEEYEILRTISQRQYRTIKACVERITLEYIKSEREEMSL